MRVWKSEGKKRNRKGKTSEEVKCKRVVARVWGRNGGVFIQVGDGEEKQKTTKPKHPARGVLGEFSFQSK
jgi:hypothetical protein